VFDLAGIYPLKMNVVGVLNFSDSPDDDAVFVDLKTAWIIQGLGHGHQDLADPSAAGGVLSRKGDRIVANASVVQYNEITPENIDSFHFHGDVGSNPITAIIAVPVDAKSSALLRGRYQEEEGSTQITVPDRVMGDLLSTILTIEKFVVAGAVTIGLATAATATLVFLLSLRLRRRERETLFKIGGSRFRIGSLMASEIVGVLALSIIIAGCLTLLTSQLGAIALRAFMSA
jgi:putative ABC transport system permease protein